MDLLRELTTFDLRLTKRNFGNLDLDMVLFLLQNARCGAEQTQTVTRQSSTITIAPIQGEFPLLLLAYETACMIQLLIFHILEMFSVLYHCHLENLKHMDIANIWFDLRLELIFYKSTLKKVNLQIKIHKFSTWENYKKPIEMDKKRE